MNNRLAIPVDKMAGYVKCICQCVLNKPSLRYAVWVENTFLRHPVSQRIDQNVKCLKTQPVDSALIEEASTVTDEEDEDMAKNEEEIQRKRNKSRLNPQHRNLMHGNMPYSEPVAWFHETVKYKRKMYGRYGQSSGVLPGMMWPTREEMEETKEYESVAYPYTIQELMTKTEEKKKEEQAKFKARYVMFAGAGCSYSFRLMPWRHYVPNTKIVRHMFYYTQATFVNRVGMIWSV